MATVCKFCPSDVRFLKTVNGRSIPFELEPSEDGTHEESIDPPGYALFVPTSQRRGRDDLFLPHAKNCTRVQPVR